MQEEVVLEGWQIGEPQDKPEEQQVVYPVETRGIVFDAVVSQGAEGKALRERLEEVRKKKRRPTLYGLLHYAKCRLVLQPLTLFGKDGPQYLTISDESINRAALLKALKFT